MPYTLSSRCLVRGCGGRIQPDSELCERCYVMLSRGVLIPSAAWFATELEFLNRQNEEAMNRICDLHREIEDLRSPSDQDDGTRGSLGR